jgi:hypothetical protein
MIQTPTKPLTLEEFLQLPETEPASEYINGLQSMFFNAEGRRVKRKGTQRVYQFLLATSFVPRQMRKRHNMLFFIKLLYLRICC